MDFPRSGRFSGLLVAMVGARSTAMAFNRIADRRLRRAQPAHRSRARFPPDSCQSAFVWVFTLHRRGDLVSVAAAMLNRLTLLLAPVALASILLYSFTKRWTLLSHLVLGWCLAIAPTGAWIAVRGAIDSPDAAPAFSGRDACGPQASTCFTRARTYDFDRARRASFDSAPLWHRAFAVDCAALSRGSICRAACVILD